MRLKKAQKEAVLKWVAEGLQSVEINARAAEFEPPFDVSRAQVDFYRKTRSIDLRALVSAAEGEALASGLAIKSERVKKLKQLAALMEADLFGGFLWTENAKSIKDGEFSTVYEYEEFNSGEVAQYRGVLDDIAKEVGERVQKQEVTGKDGEPLVVRYVEIERVSRDDNEAD